MSHRPLALFLFSALWTTDAHGGGAPHQLMVIATANHSDAATLLEHYQRTREIPNANVCILPDAPDGIAERTIDAATFAATIWQPVQDCIAQSPWPEEIDVLVTLRGLPYHIRGDGWEASLEATLALGDTRFEGEPLWRRAPEVPAMPMVLNPYFRPTSLYQGISPLAFDDFPPAPRRGEPLGDEAILVHESGTRLSAGVSWDLRPAFRIDGEDLAQALALVDRGAAADGSFPAGEWLCMEGADDARGVRDGECKKAAGLLDALGETTATIPWDPQLRRDQPVLAYLTGAQNLRNAIEGLRFSPGAIADNVTSFGAVPSNWDLAEGEQQTSVVRFLRAGVSATHGTSAEPYNTAFPSAALMVLYATGYSLGDAFTLSLPFVRWMNVVIGDPLMAPFARRPKLEISCEDDVYEDSNISLNVEVDGAWDLVEVAVYVDGVLRPDVASDFSGLPELLDPGAHEIFVVARANPAPIAVRPPFAVDTIHPQPMATGWARRVVEVHHKPEPEPEPEPTPEPPSARPHKESSGGCRLLPSVETLMPLGRR